MKDHKCEVCNTCDPIGVASTVMPYSCAYCVECARRFAQPQIVFECFYDDFGADVCGEYAELETFHEGKYITYRQWAEWRATQTSEDA